MKNPKTTIAGMLAILAAVATAVSSVLQGHALDMTLLGTAFSAVMAGIALIHAQDGTP